MDAKGKEGRGSERQTIMGGKVFVFPTEAQSCSLDLRLNARSLENPALNPTSVEG